MAAPLPPETRGAIVLALRKGGGVRAVAAMFDVAPSTVSKIGSAEGIESAAGLRVESEMADWQAKLAESMQGVLGKAVESLDDVDWSRVPPDKRGLLIGILVDKVQALTRNEADGLTVVDGWLRGMLSIE